MRMLLMLCVMLFGIPAFCTSQIISVESNNPPLGPEFPDPPEYSRPTQRFYLGPFLLVGHPVRVGASKVDGKPITTKPGMRVEIFYHPTNPAEPPNDTPLLWVPLQEYERIGQFTTYLPDGNQDSIHTRCVGFIPGGTFSLYTDCVLFEVAYGDSSASHRLSLNTRYPPSVDGHSDQHINSADNVLSFFDPKSNQPTPEDPAFMGRRIPRSDPTVSYIIYAHNIRFIVIPDYEMINASSVTMPAKIYACANEGVMGWDNWRSIEGPNKGLYKAVEDKYAAIDYSAGWDGEKAELTLQLPWASVRVTSATGVKEARFNLYRHGKFDAYHRIVSVYSPALNSAPAEITSDFGTDALVFDGHVPVRNPSYRDRSSNAELGRLFRAVLLTALLVAPILVEGEAVVAGGTRVIGGAAGVGAAATEAGISAAVARGIGGFTAIESRMAGSSLFGSLAGRSTQSTLFGRTANYLIGGDGLIRATGVANRSIVGSIAADGTVYRGTIPLFRTPVGKVLPNGSVVSPGPLGGSPAGHMGSDGIFYNAKGVPITRFK